MKRPFRFNGRQWLILLTGIALLLLEGWYPPVRTPGGILGDNLSFQDFRAPITGADFEYTREPSILWMEIGFTLLAILIGLIVSGEKLEHSQRVSAGSALAMAIVSLFVICCYVGCYAGLYAMLFPEFMRFLFTLLMAQSFCLFLCLVFRKGLP